MNKSSLEKKNPNWVLF